jgi:hypothetical protein
MGILQNTRCVRALSDDVPDHKLIRLIRQPARRVAVGPQDNPACYQDDLPGRERRFVAMVSPLALLVVGRKRESTFCNAWLPDMHMH